MRVCLAPFSYRKDQTVPLQERKIDLRGRVLEVREGGGDCDAIGGNGGYPSDSVRVTIAAGKKRIELDFAANGIRPFVRVGDEVLGSLDVSYGVYQL